VAALLPGSECASHPLPAASFLACFLLDKDVLAFSVALILAAEYSITNEKITLVHFN
jgi:hypothetical protein